MGLFVLLILVELLTIVSRLLGKISLFFPLSFRMSDYCLTPNEQFFSHNMARTSSILIK